MVEIRPLSEQTLMNNYVFSMVMREPKRIKPLLEYILQKKIRQIRMIEPEKTMKEKFESKGIRLDLYVEDDRGVIYDVEVQTTDQKNLARRMRYYQEMLDVSFFPAGADYRQLKNAYVIFICNFDPYGEKQYLYTFRYRCDQNEELLLNDGAVKIVANTKGTKGAVSRELREAMNYLDHGEVTGPYSKELDQAVTELKGNEERRQEYMTLMTYGMEREAAGKYMNIVAQIRRWHEKKSSMPMSMAADFMNVSISQFQSVLSLIQQHPDWDDRDIADQADWA
ncbi:MAG: Rpn family recombination-promoting nuclease/putative transposase [Clostridia bacterium]|nr:Rpn family recombination-promoting nuclease/putative transposase [Clostridia bacterium]